MTIPEIRRKTLVTYGGAKARPMVTAPTGEDELRQALEYANQKGWSVTFRTGGRAFDTQSLNTDLVILLTNFAGVTVDQEAETVTAGAGAPWGEVLAKSVKIGMVPHVMVTTRTASVGGTLASNSLSRFSPTLGREGRHVKRFSTMTPDLKVLECSRDKNPKLFRAAIAGLGYVGAVIEVTHELLPLRLSNIAVATTFEKVEGLTQIAARLLVNVEQRAQKHKHRSAHSAAAVRTDPVGEATAVSAVVYMTGGETGLLATSRYVDTPPDKLRRSVFHNPSSVGAWALQIAALFPVLRTIGDGSSSSPGSTRPKNTSTK